MLFSTVMFSSSSYAEWKWVAKNINGTFYVDFERIRKHDGYVYWWWMSDFPKPDESGSLSITLYSQGDCKLFRFKHLTSTLYKHPMGGGTGDTLDHSMKWKYPAPSSTGEVILQSVCNR